MTASGVEAQLLDEQLRHLDLQEYCLVTTDTTVREAVDRMREMKRHCAFVVGRGTQLVGIVTERDVLRKVINNPETWDQSVEAIMTADPRTLRGSSTTREALRLMNSGRFRNVPVVQQNGVIVGNVTHFALLRYLVAHFPEAVYNLPPDAENYADRRDGG